MDETSSTDEMWLGWMEIFKSAAMLQAEGHLGAAMEELDRYLVTNPPPDLQSDALGFRAILNEGLGNLESARVDLVRAHSLSSSGGFSRYTFELSLGDICEKLLDGDGARNWYVKALSTVAGDPLTSGGAVLRRLARLAELAEGLTATEQETCAQVAWQSWRLLGLKGEPDLNNLSRTADKLLNAERDSANPH